MRIRSLLYSAFLILITLKLSTASPLVTTPLVKNSIVAGDIGAGETANYYYNTLESSNLFLSDTSAPKAYNLYITLSTCSLPEYTKQPKPLELYISQTDSTPGPDTLVTPDSELKFKKEVDLEYVRLVVENFSPSKTLYVGVHAPILENVKSGENLWQYELSVSTTGFMESESGTPVTFHDADHNAATFSIPHEKKQNILKAYVLPEKENLTWMPLCMLSKKSLKSFHVKRDLSQESIRFRVDDLDVNSKYRIYHVEESTGPTQYRRITRGVSFGTAQAESNCVVIQPTKFCTEVNYAVPALNNGTNQTTLANMYDDYAYNIFLQFNATLQRFDCSTVYSPLRNCRDCQKAYHTWVCATTIPRCTNGKPPGGEAPGLQYRTDNPSYPVGPFFLNETNSFTEYLPCLDVCWEVVRSCPAFFQFSCPSPDPSNVDYGVAPNCNNFTVLSVSKGSGLSTDHIYLYALLTTFITALSQIL